jgi:hypothetical protein
MRKFAARGALIAASVLALTAFALPAVASASVWGPAGTIRSLDSSNASFHNSSFFSFTCSNQHLTTSVRKPGSATLDVTGFTSSGCVGSSGAEGCPLTLTPEKLPWTMTGVGTESATLNIGRVRGVFGGVCGGTEFHYFGSPQGKWSNTSHTFTLTSAGVTLELEKQLFPSTLSGSWKDPAQLLTLS